MGQTNLPFLAVCALELGGVGMILSSVERQQQSLFNTLESWQPGAQGQCHGSATGCEARMQRGSGIDPGPEAQVGFRGAVSERHASIFRSKQLVQWPLAFCSGDVPRKESIWASICSQNLPRWMVQCRLKEIMKICNCEKAALNTADPYRPYWSCHCSKSSHPFSSGESLGWK